MEGGIDHLSFVFLLCTLETLLINNLTAPFKGYSDLLVEFTYLLEGLSL